MVAPMWAGEAEIVRAYFVRPRTTEMDLRWLRAQAFKEAIDMRALPAYLHEECWQTGTVRNHPQGSAAAAKLAEEMKHFRLVASLIEWLTGKPVAIADLLELPEDTKLQDLREPYRHGDELERAVVDFTEGGGGAMYSALVRLDHGEFERRTAHAFKIILDDEIQHGPAQIRVIARLARSDADWEHVIDIVQRVGQQRLHMRNEMFSFPLTADRIEAIAAGNIEPWPMPIAF